MAEHLPPSNIQTDQSPYPFWALERFIRGFGSGFLLLADQAALAAASGEDGQHAFLLKARTEWIADTSDPGPAVPGVKIANPGGGFWVRTQYADEKWRRQVDVGLVPAWTIAKVSGDDENPGTPALPIKTHAEWARRIGNFGQWKLFGQTTVTYPSIAEVPGADDPLTLDDAPLTDTPAVGGVPIFLTIQGPPPEPKIGHGGLITAVTARVRATNTPWNVTTAGILDVTDVGLRLEIITGPRTGAVTYVDRVTGANQVDTSEWEIADLGPTTFVDTHVTPSNAGADLTRVFTQGQIFLDSARMRGGTQGSLLFKDLDLATINTGDVMQFYAEGGGIMFLRCRFLDNSTFYTTLQEGGIGSFWGLCYQLDCFAGQNNMLFQSGDYQENIINGGLYHGAVIANGGSLQWDADTMSTGGAVGATQHGAFVVGAGSAYRAPATAGFNIGSKSLLRASTLFYGVHAMYGQGNALAGVLSCERMSYDNAATLATVTVAGPPGVDFVLTAAGVVFWFDPTTATFQPPGGFAATWANMAVAQPAGLGGEAHNPARSSEIIQASNLTFP